MRGSYGRSIVGGGRCYHEPEETHLDGFGLTELGMALGVLGGVAILARAVTLSGPTETRRREQAVLEEMFNPKLKEPARAIAHFRKAR